MNIVQKLTQELIEQTEHSQKLEQLVRDYHTEVAIGKQLEDASHHDLEAWERRMDALQARAAKVLHLN